MNFFSLLAATIWVSLCAFVIGCQPSERAENPGAGQRNGPRNTVQGGEKESTSGSARLAASRSSAEPSDAMQTDAMQTDAMQDEISYTNDIQPIVGNFCTTCHAGENPEGDFVLTSYDAVRQHTEDGDLLQRINDADDPMPQDGLMPQYMRRLFKLWADGGFIDKGTREASTKGMNYETYTPPQISPVDVNSEGFELLEKTQGHWVGSMNLMGQPFDWMAFDFRPIAPSHVHAIFEGGTIGNLFTSFFVAQFNDTQTIMARNGGILNGIYRTSYFVLDKVEHSRRGSYYRLVDAYGGADIMWMELTFTGDRMEFKSYTSRFGLTQPKLHMSFEGRRMHPELAESAAREVQFPENVLDKDFSNGLPTPDWGEGNPQTSASFIWEESSLDLVELGRRSNDPYRIDQMPYLSKLTVSVERNEATQGKKLHMYLSRDALTDESGKFITEYGYIRSDLLDTLLMFPEIAATQDEFTFTYLHPGNYFLTVVADMDGDGFPSPGDISHPRKRVTVSATSHERIVIQNLDVQN